MLLCKPSESSFNLCKKVRKFWKTSRWIPTSLCMLPFIILDRNFEADLQLSCLSQMPMIVIFVPCMNKVYLGNDWQILAVFLLMMFPMVFLENFLPIFQISWRRWNGFKSWNIRSSEGIKWNRPEAWCDSCYHFHIDICQKWIWFKATTDMQFLLWSLFRQWLDFLWKHNLIFQFHCGMISYKMLFFFHETCILYNSKNWNLFSNFNIYWLWGYLRKSMASFKISSTPCIINFI